MLKTQTRVLSIVAAISALILTAAPIAALDYSAPPNPYSGGSVAILTICMMCMFMLITLLALGGLAATIYFIIDVTRRDFGSDQNQMVIWILLLFFLGFPVGIILYYFLVFKKYPLKD